MRFPGIRSVEQTEQKFRSIRNCLKKLVTLIVLFLLHVNQIKLQNYQMFEEIQFCIKQIKCQCALLS